MLIPGIAISGFTQADPDNGSKSGPVSGAWHLKSSRRVSTFFWKHRPFRVSAQAVLNDRYGANSRSLKGR